MQITEYVCDECGKKRSSDVNHWRTLAMERFAGSTRFVAYILGELQSEHVDVCGQDCAVKVFSRWLSTGKLKEGKNEQV